MKKSEKTNEKISDEQRRIEHFEKQRRQMKEQGYTEHMGTISIVKANVMALVTAAPFALAAVAIYLLYWREPIDIRIADVVGFLICFILLIPVHEGIHGLTWGLFCKKRFKSIRFGFMRESLTPYCHCMEPLSFGAYILGDLMPFFILGIGIFLVNLFTQSAMLLLVSAIGMLTAGGDTTIAWMLLPYRGAEIIDHPTDCGFAAFRKEK